MFGYGGLFPNRFIDSDSLESAGIHSQFRRENENRPTHIHMFCHGIQDNISANQNDKTGIIIDFYLLTPTLDEDEIL